VRHCNDPIDATNSSTTLEVTVATSSLDDPAQIGGSYFVVHSCDILADEYVLSGAVLYEVDRTTKIADLEDLQFAGGSLPIAGPTCDGTTESALEGTGPTNGVLQPYCGQNVWLTAFVRRAECEPVSGQQEVGSQLTISCP